MIEVTDFSNHFISKFIQYQWYQLCVLRKIPNVDTI